MKKKKIVLFVFLLVGILITIIIYNDKKNTLNNDKLIIKKSYAIMIKGDGDADYTNANSIPSDLTNYHIDTDKTFCENGGTVDIVGNKLSYQTLGSDRCTVYMYYEKPVYKIVLNVANQEGLLHAKYLKSLSNCTGTLESSWNNKLYGFEISNYSQNGNLISCDFGYYQNPDKFLDLSYIVEENGTSTTHGIRYQGKNPDNYVWFNDELWRIIGNVPVCLTSGCTSTENRVKIIRNNSLGSIVFSQSDFDETNPFTWIGSNVQNLLNTCYLGKLSSCDSYCYSYSTTAVGLCDYSSIGINASDYYGSMIEDVYYNIGVSSSGSRVNADDQYTKEIASYASTTSKIGLMYASDYGYAIEGYTGSLWDSSVIDYTNKNWLFSNEYELTMSAFMSYAYLKIYSDGKISADTGSFGFNTRPVLYLKSNVYVTGGTGTKANPYILGI